MLQNEYMYARHGQEWAKKGVHSLGCDFYGAYCVWFVIISVIAKFTIVAHIWVSVDFEMGKEF